MTEPARGTTINTAHAPPINTAKKTTTGGKGVAIGDDSASSSSLGTGSGSSTTGIMDDNGESSNSNGEGGSKDVNIRAVVSRQSLPSFACTLSHNTT